MSDPSHTRPSVLLTTEGTYPFEGGGVTTWCEVILEGLPDIDVHLLAVTGSTALTLKKALPPHVHTVQAVPLFGSVEPTEFTRAEEPFATTVLRRARTTRQMVERQFVPLLKQLLAALEQPERAGWNEARIIWEMNRYFMRLDHRATFRSEATWRAFRDTIREQESGPDGLDVRLDDLVRSLRWLYSFLLPITCPVPRADVTHATLAGFAGLAGVIAKLEYGTPFMVTDHGIYLRERYIAMSNAEDETFFCKRFLLRLVHLVSRVCYVTADQISPVCDHNQRWELRMGATPDKIRTIYNGIDTTRFVPPPPEKDAARERPTVVTAARVFPLKDIETLIRACDVTRRRVPNVHFVVFGNNTVDMPYTQKCEALIDELGVRDNFTFAGYHSNPAELYHEGDVFALSSISEGFPFSVIEAMACERPVVATDVGGVKEALVGGIGIVVPPRGFEPLGNGLADLLLDDDRRREMGRLSRERAVDQFGVERMLDAHREAYERFAGLELFPALTFVEDLAAARETDLGAVLAQSEGDDLPLFLDAATDSLSEALGTRGAEPLGVEPSTDETPTLESLLDAPVSSDLLDLLATLQADSGEATPAPTAEAPEERVETEPTASDSVEAEPAESTPVNTVSTDSDAAVAAPLPAIPPPPAVRRWTFDPKVAEAPITKAAPAEAAPAEEAAGPSVPATPPMPVPPTEIAPAMTPETPAPLADATWLARERDAPEPDDFWAWLSREREEDKRSPVPSVDEVGTRGLAPEHIAGEEPEAEPRCLNESASVGAVEATVAEPSPEADALAEISWLQPLSWEARTRCC